MNNKQPLSLIFPQNYEQAQIQCLFQLFCNFFLSAVKSENINIFCLLQERIWIN